MQEINVNKYFIWVKEGKSFSEIRKDLETRGLSDSQITTVLSTLNNCVLQSSLGAEKHKATNQWRWVAWTLIGISICLAVYSYWAGAFTFIVFSIGGIVTGWGILIYITKAERPVLFQSRFKHRKRNL